MKRLLLSLGLLGACLILQGQDLKPLYLLFKDGMFDALLAKTGPLVKEQPENAELNQLHGRALVDAGRFREAIPFLEAAVKQDKDRNWISAWSLGYLGLARFQANDPKGSKKALSDCIALNATPNASAFARKWLFSTGQSEIFDQWLRLETEHFRFVIQPPMSDPQARAFAEKREKIFQETISSLGLTKLPKKIDFLVWENRRDPMMQYRLSLGQADPDRLIVYCARDNSPGHEMTHVITPQAHPARRPSKTGLINEGVAVYFDHAGRDQKEAARSYLKRHNMKRISLADVWSNWKKYPEELSYPLAGAFVKNLIQSHGMEKFRSLLADQSLENARLVYGKELDKLLTTFEASLVTEVL